MKTATMHKYADKPQVILYTRNWKCDTCEKSATFNAIEGHDIQFFLNRHLEVIAWFKANYACCAKTGA